MTLFDLGNGPHSLGQVPNHLSHYCGQSPCDTPELWDNGKPRWVPTMKDYQDTLVVFLSSLVEDPLMTQEEVPLPFQEEVPLVHLHPLVEFCRPPGFLGEVLLVCLDPWWTSLWSTLAPWWRSPGPSDPPGGVSPGSPGDSGSQGPAGQSFMWESGSALDQSISDMNRSVMQLLTAPTGS